MKQFLKKNAVMLLFFLAVVVVMLLSIFSSRLVREAARMLEEHTERHLLATSKAAAALVSAEELMAFTEPADMELPAYAELRRRVSTFGMEYNVLFVYYLRPKDGMFQFIVDNDANPETQSNLASDLVAYEDAPLQAMQGRAVSSGFGNYSDNWAHLFTAYAPVYDSSGAVYCVAGVDISDESILRTNSNMQMLIWLQAVSLILVVVLGLSGILLYKKKAQQSQAANVAKSEFLSRMSHEIRTPMNAIIGLSRMAREADDLAAVGQALTQIDVSSKHLLRLINDILDISKIESGKMQIDEHPVLIADELSAVHDIIRPQAGQKRQNFTIDLAQDVPPCVYCDSTHIRQILVNLLSNAVKFTPEEGSITLQIRVLEKWGESCNLEWSVRDTGIGIDEKYIKHLFDPFEQGDGSTTRKYGGTGLGLSIAKQLVGMMGGELSVNSTLGSGSAFTFHCWLRVGDSALLEPAQRAGASGADISGMEILLVEDSEINQIVAENVLKGMGANVEFANDGLEGLNMFLAAPGRYALILMDVQMPVMDGYEATRAIRQSGVRRAQEIPIIAMTANVFKEDIDRALSAGMNAHIAKPLDVMQVADTIASVLQK